MLDHPFHFGKQLKQMRHSQHLTQKEVAERARISAETLRLVENGKVLPKLDTLIVLGQVYQRDILRLYSDHLYYNRQAFQQLIHTMEAYFNRDDAKSLHSHLDLLIHLADHIQSGYHKQHLHQYIQFIRGVIFYDNDHAYDLALEHFETALKWTVPHFTVNALDDAIDQPLELRILMNMAFVYHKFKQYDVYGELLNHCYRQCSSDDWLFPKICHNLSGFLIRNRHYAEGLSLSDEGIHSSLHIGNLTGLHFLYYQKAIAQFHLDDPEYRNTIHLALSLCEALKQDDMKERMLQQFRTSYDLHL